MPAAVMIKREPPMWQAAKETAQRTTATISALRDLAQMTVQ